MGIKRAKLNLDFGHNEISMNFAMANDSQPRYGDESDWNAGTFRFNTREFEDFPGYPQERIDESRIKAIADIIASTISEWQQEHGCDFDSSMEITVSANYFDVLFQPYCLKFSRAKEIKEDDMIKIEECKQSDKVSQIPILGEKIRSFPSPYYTVLNDNNKTTRLLDPRGRKTRDFGFDIYFITKHPALLRLLEVMKEDDEKVKMFLSCEKEFKALANESEREGKTLLIHITDSLTEYSLWDKSELKYVNKKEIGFKELKKIFWRLCLSYYKYPKLTTYDFRFKQRETLEEFSEMVKNAEISDQAKECLSADDCSDLLEFASCIQENPTGESFKYGRLKLPGKNEKKVTISNYVLNYFTRDVMFSLMEDIKETLAEVDFCKLENIILECPLPLKGLEKLATEVFYVPARRAFAKWNKETREDLPSSGIGSLQSLIAEEERRGTSEIKKKTKKLFAFFRNSSNAS
ncbi:MAG: hypothetical protein LBQ87_04175 [Candidatus Fibromonas sp.]|jgi:hypothetical protein|nr:hypothetical protein [Candidatus Fibromonas sp.]